MEELKTIRSWPEDTASLHQFHCFQNFFFLNFLQVIPIYFGNTCVLAIPWYISLPLLHFSTDNIFKNFKELGKSQWGMTFSTGYCSSIPCWDHTWKCFQSYEVKLMPLQNRKSNPEAEVHWYFAFFFLNTISHTSSRMNFHPTEHYTIQLICFNWEGKNTMVYQAVERSGCCYLYSKKHTPLKDPLRHESVSATKNIIKTI